VASMLAPWVIHCLLILLRVAFFTLWERKIIGAIHQRVGPNKLGVFGLLQPILDALKLLTKHTLNPSQANRRMYQGAPVVSLGISLAL